ncbi:MAG: hypothetical protein AAF290_05235 [Pseudomonadota bacterium]
MKFYTQFQVDDGRFKDSNLFSGIVELQATTAGDVCESDLQFLLSQNFDLEYEHVQLVSWSQLH